MAESPLHPPRAGWISVGSLSQASRHAKKFDAVLSLEDPHPTARLRRSPEAGFAHARIRFEDLDEAHPELWGPTPADALAILEFGRKHRDGALLAHCHAGVARSTAAALGILADRLGPGREGEALAELLRVRPQACPNLLLTRLLGGALGTGDALADAVSERERNGAGLSGLRERRRRLPLEKANLYARRPQPPG